MNTFWISFLFNLTSIIKHCFLASCRWKDLISFGTKYQRWSWLLLSIIFLQLLQWDRIHHNLLCILLSRLFYFAVHMSCAYLHVKWMKKSWHPHAPFCLKRKLDVYFLWCSSGGKMTSFQDNVLFGLCLWLWNPFL